MMKIKSIVHKRIGVYDYFVVWTTCKVWFPLCYRESDVAIQAMVDAYNNAQHWSVRRQILSIIATDFPAPLLRQYFPNMSEWKIKSARRHTYGKSRRESLLIAIVDVNCYD